WQLRTGPPALEERWRSEGFWTEDTLGQLLDRGLRERPDLAVKIRSAVRPWSGTYGDAHALAQRVAGGLRARGIGPGDVVAFQLPNWVEAVATFWAVSLL